MKLLLSLLLVFGYGTLSAQQPSHYIVGEDELAGVHIYSMLQDKDHTVWLSSDNGLYHYDGLKFESIPSSASNDMSLFGLVQNSKGRVFCFNLSGEILYIEHDSLKVFCQVPKAYLSNRLYIGFDNDDKLLISSKHLLKYEQGKFSSLLENSDAEAKPLSKNPDGGLGFWDYNKLYTFIDGQLKLAEENIQRVNNNILVLAYTQDKQALYVSHTEPIALYREKEHFVQVNYKVNTDNKTSYYPYFARQKDIIWFAASKNGLYAFRKNGEPLFNNNCLFKNYFISSYLEDNEGNFWFSTFGKGIIIVPNLDVLDYANVALLDNEDITHITRKNKTLYFGSVKGNIFRLENDQIQVLKSGFKKIEYIRYLAQQDKFFVNNLIFDGQLQRQLGMNTYTKNDIYACHNSDSIFYVTRSGLYYLSPNFEKKETDFDTRTYALYYDEEQATFWLAAASGLETKRGSRAQKILVDGQPVFSNSIIRVGQQIWVASTVGILIFENDSLTKRINTNKGLLSNHCLKLIYQAPYVYISNNEGLQRYDIQEERFLNFTKTKGLLSNAIFDFEIKGKEAYIITSKGIQKLNFDKLPERKSFPEVKFKQVLVNGFKTISNHARLRPGENNIAFSLYTISHRYKHNLSYVYRLEGVDNKWSEASFLNNTISYTRLPAGNYRFSVRLKDDSGIGEEISLFSFSIQTVFWKTGPFIISVVALLILAMILYYRIRIRLLIRKQNQEIEQQKFRQELNQSKLKALKSQMNPHFMFNALNSIQEFIIQNKKELASNYLGDFADLMRNYLQQSQEDTISLKEEIETLELYLKLEKIRFEEDFDYAIESEKQIELDSIKIPSFLIQPFVENAIKHGLLHKEGQKTLHIAFQRRDETFLSCTITDNGIGRAASREINKNKRHRSFATEASQNRLKLLNQNIQGKIGLEITDLRKDNGDAAGTRIQIMIPITH